MAQKCFMCGAAIAQGILCEKCDKPRKKLALSGAEGSGEQQLTPPPMPAILRNYQPVTPERLLKPEDGNWPMIRRTYDGWGYSPLDQITPANVARLKLVWSSTTGEGRAHEAAPVVNNGVLFITTPFNQVIAFDGTTGTVATTGPAIDTSRNFTVSAWTKSENCCGVP